MKKGDQRKQDIIQAAETLFYQKGYEATSIQDILDALHLSKGGFYHHFVSKSQLLELLCEQKVQGLVEGASRAVAETPGGAVDALNTFLENCVIWKSQHTNFILLLMQVSDLDENSIMREKLREKTMAFALPAFAPIIQKGVDQAVFFSPYPEQIAALILHLVLKLGDDIAALFAPASGELDPLPKILRLLEVYRHAVERLLDAPFGTVLIHSMASMSELCQTVTEHLRHNAWESFHKTQS